MLRRGPHVVPPPEVIRALIARRAPDFWRSFGEAADRALAGISGEITSWYRTPAQNAALPGSAVGSQHLYGCAFDLVLDDPAQRTRVIAALRRETFFVIDEGDHLHVQAFPAGALQRARL